MMSLNSIKIIQSNLRKNIEVLDGTGTKKTKCLNGKNNKIKKNFKERKN